MKFLFPFCTFLALLLSSCQTEQANQQPEVMVQDSSGEQTLSTGSLQGIWRLNTMQTPTFIIGEDSIYYLEDKKNYKYLAEGDSLLIYYPTWTFRGMYILKGNELSTRDKDSVYTFMRMSKAIY